MKKFYVFLAVLLILITASESFATINITATNLKDGTVGKTYQASFAATSTNSAHISDWDMSGTIPGLIFNGVSYSGYLSGKPSQAGTFSFTITVTDNAGNKGSKRFSIRINKDETSGSDSDTVRDIDTELPPQISGYFMFNNQFVGEEFPTLYYGEVRGRLIAENGTPPYTWSIIKGDLPNGLALDCGDEDIYFYGANTYSGPYAHCRGIVTTPGTYEFTIQVTDALGRTASTDISETINGEDMDAFSIGDYNYGEGRYAREYAYFAGPVKNGRGPYTWSVVAGNLPTGLYLACKDSSGKDTFPYHSNTGKYPHLRGAPGGIGTCKFILRVTDKDGRSAEKEYSITIKEGSIYSANTPDPNANEDEILVTNPIPTITGNFSQGTMEKEYAGYIEAGNGTGPYNWEIVYGAIPSGMTLTCSDSTTDKGTGTTGRYAHITGTTKIPGYYNFTLKTTDSKGSTNARTFTLKIAGDPLKIYAFSITTDSDLTAEVSKDFSVKLEQDSGETVSWYMDNGTKLPDGLTLSADGEISGKVEKADTYKFSIRAISSKTSATKDFTLIVKDVPAPTPDPDPSEKEENNSGDITPHPDPTPTPTPTPSPTPDPTPNPSSGDISSGDIPTPAPKPELSPDIKSGDKKTDDEEPKPISESSSSDKTITSDDEKSGGVTPSPTPVPAKSGVDIEKHGPKLVQKLKLSEGTEILELDESVKQTPRSVDDVTEAETNGEKVVVALPSMTVTKSALYIYSVTITNLDVGEKISLHISEKVTGAFIEAAAEKEASGILIDDNGEELTKYPADGKVNIASYMETGKTYSPIITTEQDSPTSEDSGGSGGGGGCDSGLGIFGLMLIVKSLIQKRLK